MCKWYIQPTGRIIWFESTIIRQRTHHYWKSGKYVCRAGFCIVFFFLCDAPFAHCQFAANVCDSVWHIADTVSLCVITCVCPNVANQNQRMAFQTGEEKKNDSCSPCGPISMHVILTLNVHYFYWTTQLLTGGKASKIENTQKQMELKKKMIPEYKWNGINCFQLTCPRQH